MELQTKIYLIVGILLLLYYYIQCFDYKKIDKTLSIPTSQHAFYCWFLFCIFCCILVFNDHDAMPLKDLLQTITTVSLIIPLLAFVIGSIVTRIMNCRSDKSKSNDQSKQNDSPKSEIIRILEEHLKKLKDE